MKALILIFSLLFFSLNATASTCEAGDGKCVVTCPGDCIAYYDEEIGKCDTECLPESESNEIEMLEEDPRFDECVQSCEEEGFTKEYCEEFGCGHLKD